MALTWMQYIFKVARALFYGALFCTTSYQGFGILGAFLSTPENNLFVQCLKTVSGLFLYSMAVILTLSLLIGELAEETEDDVRNTSRYAVHERKLATGFLKDTSTETSSSGLFGPMVNQKEIHYTENDHDEYEYSLRNSKFNDNADEIDELTRTRISNIRIPMTDLYAPSANEENMDVEFVRNPNAEMTENVTVITADVIGELKKKPNAPMTMTDNVTLIRVEDSAAPPSSRPAATRKCSELPNIDKDYLESFRSLSLPGLKLRPPIVNSFHFMDSVDKFLVGSESKTITFKDLGGLDKLKHILQECLLYPLTSSSSIRVEDLPRAIMLSGDEDAGKTFIANGIAGQLKVTAKKDVKFYKIESSSCFGPFIGCGVTFQDIFVHVSLENSGTFSVLLFENIDHLNDKSANAFLSELGSLPSGTALVVATCRCRDRLDERFLRSGTNATFDYIFDIELPNFWTRVAILRIQFAKRNCPIEEQDILDLAKFTRSFNAGQLEKLSGLITWKAIQRYNATTSTQRTKQLQDNSLNGNNRDYNGILGSVSVSLPPVGCKVSKDYFLPSMKLESRQRKRTTVGTTHPADEAWNVGTGNFSQYNYRLPFDLNSPGNLRSKEAQLAVNKHSNNQYICGYFCSYFI